MGIYLGSDAVSLYTGSQGSLTQDLVDENARLTNTLYTSIFGGDDATATSNDIVEGYKGLSNHQIVEGSIPIERVNHDYVKIDGEYVQEAMNLETEIVHTSISVSTLPYGYGCAVVWNNEIHILGNVGTTKKHYKYNGTSWESVSTLPYDFYRGSAVVWNNEIHILGGFGNYTNHYKYNGSSWESVSTLPYDFYDGSAVVCNDKIHILGGSGGETNHYTFNGSGWEDWEDLRYDFYNSSAVVYNNEIHILVGTNHDGLIIRDPLSSSTLPYQFYRGSAVVYNNEIHILGGTGGETNHYKYTYNSDNHEYTWESVSTLPCNFYDSDAVVCNDKIHILCNIDNSHYIVSMRNYKEV